MKNGYIGLHLSVILYLGLTRGQIIDPTTSQESNPDEYGDDTNLFESQSFEEKYSLFDRQQDDSYKSKDDRMDPGNEKILADFENEFLSSNLLLNKPSVPFISSIFSRDKYLRYFLYTRETINNPEIVDSRHLTEFKNLKQDKPIKIIIHGWKGYSECVFSTHMRDSYLPLLDVNLILVDWSGHNARSNFYPLARYQVPEVGRITAEFLDFLATRHNTKLSEVQVIGHSLGAHIAGVAGRLVKSGRIGRMTGLDPAGPEFKYTSPLGRLSPESALFVDVIHTGGHYLGLAEPLGHVDFYPNGGSFIQPGCGLDIIGRCSHRRSYQLYTETLTNPYGYPGVPCNDWSSFRMYTCTYSSIAYMGEKASKTTLGKYYLQTNRNSPFSRAFDGIHFTAIY